MSNKAKQSNDKGLYGFCSQMRLEKNGVGLGDANAYGDGMIPTSDHEYLMDMVITPSRIYDHTKRA